MLNLLANVTLNLDGAYISLFYLALMILVGLLFGKIAERFNLPEVTGYIVAGMLLSGVGLITHEQILKLDVVTNIALGFITFQLGTLLWWPKVKARIKEVLLVLGLEIIFVMGFTFGLFMMFNQPIWRALIIAAISVATAAAPVIEITKKHRSKGPVTDTLYSVVGFDNVVGVILFLFTLVVAVNLKDQTAITIHEMIEPLKNIGLAVLLGIMLSLVMSYAQHHLFTRFERHAKHEMYLVFSVSFVLSATVGSILLGVPYVITTFVLGFIFTNRIDKPSYKFETLTVDEFIPPLFIAFFVIAGAELSISMLIQYGFFAILYAVGHASGKLLAGYLGTRITKPQEVVKRYLPTSILTQGGIEIGLATIAVIALDDPKIKSVILTAVLIFEFFAPLLMRRSLNFAGELREFHGKCDPVSIPNDHPARHH
jgi:Kef-type K+ transport system membrane component KefB